MAGIRNLAPDEVFRFICRDFETAWDAIAGLPDTSGVGRGNFVFALQATVLLEWACRLCAADRPVSAKDPTPAALADFGRALYAIRPEYFMRVAAEIDALVDRRDNVRLPPSPVAMRRRGSPLLWLLWDVIRNGQAHQYQQIVANQPDGQLYVALGGPRHQLTLEATITGRLFEKDHLAPERQYRRALGIRVWPQWLYLDLRDAVRNANLLDEKRSLKPKSLTRSYTSLATRGLAASLRRAHRRRLSPRYRDRGAHPSRSDLAGETDAG